MNKLLSVMENIRLNITKGEFNYMSKIITSNKIETVTSMEVAKMINKEHSELMRDIRRYINQLNESKIGLVDFFVESTL